MRALGTLLLLTATALSGCASGPDATDAGDGTAAAGPLDLSHLSQAVFDILPVEEVWLPMDDGKRMHSAVYRPDTNASVPVFINFSPYWGDTAEVRGDAFSQYMIDEYVPRGYAVVLAAIRGTGHSEGCFQIGGDRELQDMHDVVDFFANEPWSNGAVATGGKSYDSSPTNGLIAKYPHPALRGVFHVSGITDMYGYNYKGGVPYATGPVFNTYYYLQGTDEYGASLIGAGSTDDEGPESLARLVDDAACTELPRMQASGVGSGAHGMKDDYWVERDWSRYVADSEWNGSIFFVHGLQDWNVKPDHVLPWIENLPDQVRTRGWLHQWVEGGTGHVYPMRDDWNETFVAWLDTELKGRRLAFWDAPAWDVQGTDGLWRDMATWPPEEPRQRQPDRWSGEDGAVVFEFEAAARLTGAPVVHVGATATPDRVLTAVLERNGEWIGEAVLRAAYRDGLGGPAAPSPGQVQYGLVAYPMDVVFAPGDTLTVTLGADARHSVTAGMTQGVEYNLGTVTLEGHFASVDARADQPVPTPCFTC